MVHIKVAIMDNLKTMGEITVHQGHLDGDYIELALDSPEDTKRVHINCDEAEGLITALQLAVKHARPKKVRMT